MENKNNFTGIIIPVIVAVILLTVLPIINSINGECPPCEECPIYNIGNMEVNPNFSSGNYIVDKGSYDYIDSVTIIKDDDLIPENIKKGTNIFGVEGTYEEEGESSPYEYILPIIGNYSQYDVPDPAHLTVLFAPKSKQTTINGKTYYSYFDTRFINYELSKPSLSRENFTSATGKILDYYYIFWEDFTDNTLTIQAPFNPIDFECLGIFYASPGDKDNATLSFNNEVGYKSDKVTSTPITNGIIFDLTKYSSIFDYTLQGDTRLFYKTTGEFRYLPKLGSQNLSITYDD